MAITLILNSESAAVLLRCLGYGQSAISSDEGKTGVKEVINRNVDSIRRQICKSWADQIISSAADERTRQSN